MRAEISLRDPEAVANSISEFIREQVEVADVEKAVVALSGGLDSALVATLAVRALGKGRVATHILPDGEVTQSEDMADAEALAESLDVLCRSISIHRSLEALKGTLQEAGLVGSQMAWANVKPRLRMIVNYFVANFERGIVLGTGNRSELLLGYFTKFGDGGADLLPLGRLYKTQVRQLAEHLGLPGKITQKPPSAGLWEGQTDEGEIGLAYDQLDALLYDLTERSRSAEEIAQSLRVEPEVVARIERMVKANAHKRALPPMPG